MSTINAEVYDALKEAGASEEKARSAAESVASFDGRFHRTETDLAVIKWMLGVVLVAVVIPLIAIS